MEGVRCICLARAAYEGEEVSGREYWLWELPILWEQWECWTCVCVAMVSEESGLDQGLKE